MDNTARTLSNLARRYGSRPATLLLMLLLCCTHTYASQYSASIDNSASSARPGGSEDELFDAALLTAITYKLSKFITWPQADQSFFNICHYGNRYITSALRNLEQRTINGLPVKVHPVSAASFELNNCQILFINDTDTEQTRKLLLSVSRSPVLTLSNISKFTDFGGMIELARRGQRYHFLINLKAARNSDLKIASPLLELSTIVSN